MMEIKQFTFAPLNSNMYVVRENSGAIIIDPCVDVDCGVTLVDQIFLTHEHYDHLSQANQLREKYNCPILCGETCGARITSSTSNFSRYFDALVAVHNGTKRNGAKTAEYVCRADQTFSGALTVNWRNHTITLTETAGHSPGSICVLLDGKILFSGDSLIATNETILRFPGGSEADFQSKTLPYLLSLPMDTIVYPGHGESFRLWEHELMREEVDGGIF